MRKKKVTHNPVAHFTYDVCLRPPDYSKCRRTTIKVVPSFLDIRIERMHEL